jgi:hypothetical protein
MVRAVALDSLSRAHRKVLRLAEQKCRIQSQAANLAGLLLWMLTLTERALRTGPIG